MSVVESDNYEPERRARRLAGPLFGAACLLATLTGVVVLSVVLGAVAAAALGHGSQHPWYAIGPNAWKLGRFLVSLTQKFSEDAGFRAGVYGSLWLLALTVLFAVPTGVGAAVFLEEFTPPGRLRRAIQMNIANLAGVPSIVYGILGLALFVRAFGFESFALGRSLWAGALTLALLVLPVIVLATQEALRSVPSSLRHAALALGASRWETVRDHVLPMAVPGILTGTILAVSRAIGETAPVLMVGAAGSIDWIPNGPGDRYTALPVEIYNYAKEPGVEFQSVAAGGILLLLVILLTMNSIAIVIRNKYRVPTR
ncbi:MAG: phosphate transporter, permease protein PstA [Planctomycetota bacterium]|nr:phosphate transporter, permease protein PstA [Planctomycetota bacterium]